MNKSKKRTAAEAIAEMHADPKWVAAKQERDRLLKERTAQLLKAELPVRVDLARVGISVESVWDLVNTSKPYPAALPVLLEHLSRSYPDRVREGIARALAVSDSHFAWAQLLEAFRAEKATKYGGVKWALACALGAAGTDQELAEVLLMLDDTSLGINRAPLLNILGRSSDPIAHAKLEQLQNDAILGAEARRIRKKSRARTRRARSQMETSSRVSAMNDKVKAAAESTVGFRDISEMGEKQVLRKHQGGEKGHREDGEARANLISQLSEASMSFDAELVAPFLDQLSAVVQDFGPMQIAEVMRVVEELAVDDERELDFNVSYGGQSVPLTIRIFMDDVDAPDLYFHTTANLAAQINSLMEVFCEAHGL